MEDSDNLSTIDRALASGDLDKAVTKSRDFFIKSPDWNIPIKIYTPLIVEAFSFGVLSADFWFRGYKVPINLDLVINWIAFNVQREYPDDYAEITLNELEAKLRDWMSDNPWVKEWNDDPKQNNMTRKFYLALNNLERGEVMTSRPFVELESVVRNAAILVRDHWKHRLQLREGGISGLR